MPIRPVIRNRFLALWDQIATHYADAPREVFFELQNEPHDALTTAVWNDLLADTLDVVRTTNPDRMVIVGPGMWNGSWELDNLQLPDDPALIGTFHMYEPFQFTHQGAEWVGGADAWLGTTWSGSTDDIGPIQQALDYASAWTAATGVPVLMGEFGSYEEGGPGVPDPVDEVRAVRSRKTRVRLVVLGVWCRLRGLRP